MSREHLPKAIQDLEKKTILDISRINIQALINHPLKYTQLHFREAEGILDKMDSALRNAYIKEGFAPTSKEVLDSDGLENIQHYKTLLKDLIKVGA